MHLKLIFLLIILIFLSSTGYNFYGEISFLELLQVLILCISLGVLLREQQLFLAYTNKFSWLIKIFLFMFLIYEELSFLTEGSSGLFNSINNQSEVNLHNANFLQQVFIYVEIPMFEYSANIMLHIFVTFLAVFLLAYGSSLPGLRYFDFVFLEKDYAIYSFVYIFSIIFDSINVKTLGFNLLPSLHPEFAELFIYCLFGLDVMLKKKRMLVSQE